MPTQIGGIGPVRPGDVIQPFGGPLQGAAPAIPIGLQFHKVPGALADPPSAPVQPGGVPVLSGTPVYLPPGVVV